MSELQKYLGVSCDIQRQTLRCVLVYIYLSQHNKPNFHAKNII